jgi:phosphoribosylformylglycinamidine synthase subunit PurL
VAEAARNVVCAGALPTAVTNNLNFGSPLKPHIYHQMREAVLGMAEACSLFETPVTGGNVSLFNETDGKAIYPTPVIGMVGILDDVEAHATTIAFQAQGDVILLLGENREEIGGSEYLYRTEGMVAGKPPVVDLLAERRLQHGVLGLIQRGLVRSAHDCAEGGLAFALLESALGEGEDPLRGGRGAPRPPGSRGPLLRGEHGPGGGLLRPRGRGGGAGGGPGLRGPGAGPGAGGRPGRGLLAAGPPW